MGKENKQKNAFQNKNIMGNIQKKYILMKLKIENKKFIKKYNFNIYIRLL